MQIIKSVGPGITRRPREEWKQVKWSDDFDGKSIVELMMYKEKMSYADVLNIIKNEGGSVDEQGIIHRRDRSDEEILAIVDRLCEHPQMLNN